MRHTVRYAAFLLVVIATAVPAAMAAGDPFIGKWQLDPGRSRYESGTIPQSMTISMEATDQGVHYHSETVFSNGRHSTTEYTASYDERLTTVQQDGGLSAPVSLKRIDANTVEARYERGFRTIATSRRVVSDDGQTMTITTVETTKEGKTNTNMSLFHRLQ
ncbi:MAG TPA: hypothetical protein VI653_27300 [Steroidobacteraceae bacterium]